MDMLAEYLKLLHKACTLDCSLSVCSRAAFVLPTLSALPDPPQLFLQSALYTKDLALMPESGILPVQSHFMPDFSGGEPCTTVNYSQPAQLSG